MEEEPVTALLGPGGLDYREPLPVMRARVELMWNNLTDEQRDAMSLLERAAFVFLYHIDNADAESLHVAELLHAQVGHTEHHKQLLFIITHLSRWENGRPDENRVRVVRAVVRTLLPWIWLRHNHVRQAMRRPDVTVEQLVRACRYDLYENTVR